MNIKIRAVLFSITLIFVATVGPALVLYAQGYRYNFAKHRIEQTGVMFIKSYPRSSSITINDQLSDKKTPTEIPNLLPASYRISITKPGYTTWQKELSIEPKKTTFLEDVTLFKSEPVIDEVLKSPINQSLCSTKDHKLATFSTDTLSIIDSNRNKVTNQAKFDPETEIISWSNNSINILLKDAKGYYIYSPDSQVKSLVTYNKIPLQNVSWENNSDTTVYGVIKKILYKYNFSTNKAEIYSADYNWQIVQPMNDLLIGIHQNENKMFLSIIKGKNVNDLIAIPSDDNYEINILSDKYLLLTNKSLNVAYIINPNDNDNPLQTYVSNIKNFSWLNDTLLYWNEHEINVYHVPSKTKQTIERTSEQISNVSWHNGLVNIFAVINGQLKIYELDNRDRRNVINYQDLGKIDNKSSAICFSKSGDELYTIYNTNDRQGIYKLTIQ